MFDGKIGRLGILFSILIFFAILFLRTAWLCDDAYITFRVVDNFVNGYGLRWNVDERVQVYTHPFWMLLQIPFYFFTNETFLTWIFVSFGVSMLAILFMLLLITKNISQMLLAWSLLGFSRAFVDFSSSGLENPLSHVLLILFFSLFFLDKNDLKKLFWLSFIVSLAGLNRQDCVLVYLPALLYSWWKTKNRFEGIFIVCLGFLPLIFWEIFSLIYYGFPFPNTAYAKLGAGVWKIDLIIQGLRYIFWSWKNDLITILGLVLACIMPFYIYEPKLLVSVFGLVLYLFYVIWVGGDFMGGRFLTVPFLLAVILILRYSNLDKIKRGIPTVLIFLIVSIIQPYTPIFTNASFGENLSYYHSDFQNSSFVGNERMFYFQVASLVHWKKDKPMPSNNWAQRGREYRKQDKETVKSHGAIGATGFFAGPKIHIVDYYALADPLLARLPTTIRPTWSSGWRIGHLGRHIPEGYIDTIADRTGQNKIKDKDLAEYYKHLTLITRGPLWSFERLIDIVKINLGYYDYLINRDYYMFPYLKRIGFSELENSKDSKSGGFTVPKNGLAIKFGELKTTENMKFESDSTGSFLILFFKENKWLSRVKIDIEKETMGSYRTQVVRIPFFVRIKGFDEIRIFPYPGDADFLIRRLDI